MEGKEVCNKTVVILGAGLAGVPLAHHLLTRTAAKIADLRVVLVSPNTDFFWNVAAVRAAVPGQLADDKLFFPLRDAFARHGADERRFELVHGRAVALEPESNAVEVRLNDPDPDPDPGRDRDRSTLRRLEYHTLIIATGSDARDDGRRDGHDEMPWKSVGGDSARTRAALARLRAAVARAGSIVVAGAGTTGVELAGELASEYGGGGGSGAAGTKRLTLISSDAEPLERRLLDGVRATARRELERLNVDVIVSTRVTDVEVIVERHRADGDGDGDGTDGAAKRSFRLELTGADGSKRTLETDLYLPAFGVRPNADFAPAEMRESAGGRLRQDSYLRSPGHANIFVVGDVGNLQPAQATHVDAQIRHLARQLEPYLQTGAVEEYKVDDKVVVAVTVGRDRGTGQYGCFKLLSLVVWYLKGRYLGTDYSREYAEGTRTLGGKWPPWP